MKKAALVILIVCLSACALFATKGDRNILAGIGLATPRYQYQYIGSKGIKTTSFELSIGYQEEVFDNILLVTRAAYGKGKLKAYGGTMTGTLTGTVTSFHALVGACYGYQINDVAYVSGGLGFDCYASTLDKMKWVTSSTTTNYDDEEAAVAAGLALMVNADYIINSELSAELGVLINMHNGGINISTSAKYAL